MNHTYSVGAKIDSFAQGLPVGTITRDEDGDTATKVRDNPEMWGRIYVNDVDSDPINLLNHAPAGTIIFLPEQEPAKVGDVVSTEAELQALPVGTVARDKGWDIWKKTLSTGWHLAGIALAYGHATMADTVDAPFTILHIPGKDN